MFKVFGVYAERMRQFRVIRQPPDSRDLIVL
ncbi:hypothetical protein SAMN05216571_11511 [Onishia taeanensis]|uniref:Uncharacterized protein n=1 Tax=Onishia taeanensis TaxID=284577 RepID=A0A1G7ULE4_9GAMM|nr:hypothetical protein SAMN05216571_11511 [Halomonas taeanensis]